MKKMKALFLTIVAAVMLVGCGEEEKPAVQVSEPVEEVSEPVEAVEEIEMEVKQLGHILVSVPATFGDVVETEGYYTSTGPNSSISATPVFEVELLPEEWDEALAVEAALLYAGTTYTNVELALYGDDMVLNGNKAVYFSFYGTNAQGQEKLVHMIRLFNNDITAQHVIILGHFSSDAFFDDEMLGKIINSITLPQEAQQILPEGL